jgi:bifunctional non-homologous end joining protein LigD
MECRDITSRFPLAAVAVAALPANSFLIDGETIVANAKGLAVFDLVRRKRHGGDVVLIAFDLIRLDGEDLRRSPIEHRKRKLAKLVRGPHPGIVLNELFEGDGDVLFKHACKLGWIALSLGPFASLAQDQESCRSSSKARG